MFHLALFAVAALIVGGLASSPANGEATHQLPGQSSPLTHLAMPARSPASLAAEPLAGEVTPTPTEVLLIRWLLGNRQHRQSVSTATTEALLMRWLITKNTKPAPVSTTSATEPAAPVTPSPPAPSPPAPSPPPSPPAPSPPAPSPPAPSPPAAPAVVASAPAASGYGCAAALAYLEANAAPGYQFECPGYADGHYGMTCDNIAGICPGQKVIVISVPCPVTYMNEASNSLVLSGLSDAPIDPYGEGCYL